MKWVEHKFMVLLNWTSEPYFDWILKDLGWQESLSLKDLQFELESIVIPLFILVGGQ